MTSLPAWVRTLFNSTSERARLGPAALTRSDDPESFEDEHNAFALAVHEELRASRGNLVFSPFSIRLALAMSYAGARGKTAMQMREALRLVSSEETLHLRFADVIQRLNAVGAETCEAALANSVWSQDGSPLLPEFVDRVVQHYGAGVNLVNFRDHPEVARVTINRWVEDKTKGRIQHLLSPGAVKADTGLVIANAVYFKGTWVLPFPKRATRDELFYTEGGGAVPASLMYQEEQIRYLHDRGFQAVNLDFEGGDVSMIVLLPDKRDGLWDFEQTVSAQMLRNCFPRMVEHEVKLSLPRFRMTWGTVDVRPCLQALGMSVPFDPSNADFSGINGLLPPHEDSLFISAVFHKALVEVNEEGAEASAATAAAMTYGALPARVTFRADHPFLFAIRDTKSGAILFLGRVANPTAEG